MASDAKSLLDAETGELEIEKENRSLEEKYEELLKEIAEKSELMDKQLTDKEEGTTKIETQMTEQMASQEVDLRKQIDIYKEEAVKKKNNRIDKRVT